MLYQIYEAQRSIMEPFSDLAQAASKLFSNHLNPSAQTPMAQQVSAGYALMHRLGKDYIKPEFGIRSITVNEHDVAIHERIEINKPFCELRRFKRFTDDAPTLTQLKGQPAVLIVAPLSGHYATLLRDTVKTMLQGHKVYITDWKNARLVPMSEGAFHLDDYINYVQEFIRHLQSIYGHCHVVSVCQPTVPVLAAVSLMASRGEKTPLTMTMMGGPIDARKSPTSVNNLATNKPYEWFENNVIHSVPASFPGAGRRVYPGFLQYTGFVAMNPDRHATSHYDYFKNLIKGDDTSTEAHRKFYDEYNAVLDMDADYYLETIKTVFQDFSLVKGTWDVKGVDGKVERVRPQDIKGTALMTVEGELDDISGSGQTRAAQDLCTGVPSSERLHLEVPGAGHYGIFSGRRWRETVYPALVQFISSHSPKAGAKAAVKVAVKAAVTQPIKPLAVKAAEAQPARKVTRPAVKATAKTSPKLATKTVAKTATKTATKTVAKKVTKKLVPSATPSAVKSVPQTARQPAALGKPTATVKTNWVAPQKQA